ncbi:hypothetical protein [Rubrimonas sp.]|uniref:hypothetical protein n=1 Tax=Rubrimonas sp. TaxID=2036015 RepID=UPI002FDE3EAD
MNMAPLKLLLTSYALSAAAAAAIAFSADGALAPVLAFWLGGPVIVFALATLPGLRDLYRAPDELLECRTAEGPVAHAIHDPFEIDRLEDAPSPTAERARAGG